MDSQHDRTLMQKETSAMIKDYSFLYLVLFISGVPRTPTNIKNIFHATVLLRPIGHALKPAKYKNFR